jgi:acyl-CoA synthetase (AMP-forming)/AMP-acid ligase II
MQSTLNQVIGELRSPDSSLHIQDAGGLTSLNYRELRRLILGNAEHFSSLRIGRGDRVIISLNTDVEHIVTFFALIAIGAIPISVKPARTSENHYAHALANLCDRFDVSYSYHTLPSLGGVQSISWNANARSDNPRIIAEVEPDDVVFVQFSSGSTTAPRPVPISHTNLLANLRTLTAADEREPTDTTCNFLPLSHDMGLVGGVLSNLIRQNSLVLMPTSYFLRRPLESLEAIYRLGVDIWAMPDFALRFCSRYLSASKSKRLPHNALARLRILYCGAEPIKIQTVGSFLESTAHLGMNPHALFFCYGLAEATLLVSGRHFSTLEESFDRSLPARSVARLGPPLGGVEIRIGAIGEDGQNYSPEEGEEGSVQLRGTNIFRGYWGDRPRAVDEWFDTGDIGYMRQGELHICGRTKEMLIVNGENIFPVDIESALSELDAVKDSLAMTDDDRLYVLVVPPTGTKIEAMEISTHLSQRFGVSPKAVIQATPNHIIRTTSGKPKRAQTLSELRRAGLLPDEDGR